MHKQAAQGIQLSQLAAWLEAPSFGADVLFSGATQDSRSIQPGQLFVALPGAHVDGHDYVEQARNNGAVAALVARQVAVDIPQVVVADVEVALQRAASAWRECLNVQVVAVTGSCGKTTVKQMLMAIFSSQAETLATAGNLNNQLGVPLTLLSLLPSHRYAVVEMGASGKGDIELLCDIAKPNVGMITMVAPAHLEGFGSIEGVANAKAEIYQGLQSNGVAVINSNEQWASDWQAMGREIGARAVTFGSDALADVSVSRTHCQSWIEGNQAGSRFNLNLPSGVFEVSLPLPGWHNVQNACAAAAAAIAVGLSAEAIVTGLQQVRNVAGRLQISALANGALLVDDSYNANPASVRAAVEWLSGCDLVSRRLLVLGEMAELGDESAVTHQATGEMVASNKIDGFWACGDHDAQAMAKGFGAAAHYHQTHSSLVDELAAELAAGDVLLVKGSRSAGMDKVVKAVAERIATHSLGDQGHAG